MDKDLDKENNTENIDKKSETEENKNDSETASESANNTEEISIEEELKQSKIRLKKRLIYSSVTVVVLVLLASLFAAYGEKAYFEDNRLMMDTVITIKGYGFKGYLGMQAAFKKISEIEKLTSFYYGNSQLAKLNATGYHPYDFNNKFGRDLLREIAMGAKFYYESTEGYFDPSFAALHEIYGFHTPNKVGRLPSDDEIKNILLKCGFTHVLRFEENGIKLDKESMIDFGGITGGYAIVCAREILKASGCNTFLIDDSGDIWFQGEKPDKSPWTIAVRDPRDNSSLAKIVSTKPLAISTSGDYERFIVVDGKQYGHIMNPKTGRPADYYDSVTVVTNDPIQSDVLSTAVFAIPPDMAFEWVEKKHLAALFLTKEGKVHLSSEGKKYFSEVKE